MPVFLKAARLVVEKVEEYRFHSGYIGDVAALPLGVLAVRLNAFYAVVKKNNTKSANGGAGGKSARRRMRR